MRIIATLLLLTLAACGSSKSHVLPETSSSDPTWQLNEGRWVLNDNIITTPPQAGP